MKIIKFFLILLLLGAIIQTSSLVNADDQLTLLQDTTETEDEDETETKDEDETETKDEDEDEDEDTEDEKDEKEDAYEREIELEQEDDKFQLQSELKVGEKKDKIEVEFKVEDTAEISLKYKTETDALEAKFKYRVEFERIVEYWDVDGMGFSNTSTELSELKFKDWDTISYEIITVNGADVYVVTATTADQIFSLVLKFAASIISLEDGAVLTPNSVKIDVVVNNYDYQWDNSSLAVEAKIKTENKVEKDEVSLEEEAGFAQGESQLAIGDLSEGFFSWAETAMADGLVIDVVASTLQESSHEDDDLEENETSQKLYFSFIATNATEIVWDPKVGVVSEGTQDLIAAIESKYAAAVAGEDSSLPGFGFWMILVSLGMMQVLRLRKPKNN